MTSASSQCTMPINHLLTGIAYLSDFGYRPSQVYFQSQSTCPSRWKLPDSTIATHALCYRISIWKRGRTVEEINPCLSNSSISCTISSYTPGVSGMYRTKPQKKEAIVSEAASKRTNPSTPTSSMFIGEPSSFFVSRMLSRESPLWWGFGNSSSWRS